MNNQEDVHQALYEAHWAMVAANDKIHATIVAIHAAGRCADSRCKFAPALAPLERARELLDQALREAGNGRSELIRATGCDGKCSDRAIRPFQGKQTATADTPHP